MNDLPAHAGIHMGPAVFAAGIRTSHFQVTWVYILQCSDNSYYTGHTDHLEARLYQHDNKIFPTCYTATRLPVKLAYSEQYPSRIEALQAEKQIQGWSRKKKEALISGHLEKLSCLARRKKK